ncbi:hypothetical protein G7085_10720 [Tessaracoccus sp. HDW20]|uniref:hypothetical protein n=1 Tax=Tessaracoccus coleopterorum TaxID=2714950 RepID=UPI0018D3441D|nr:hypothetical protein [Tessaracoccus coleopterorum]NHB84924.1 hypothetical protein [Tessaracoccus coleopterorum]
MDEHPLRPAQAAGEPQHVAQVRGSVTVKDLSRVAGLLGDLASMDGVEIGDLQWRLSEETLRRIQPEVLRGRSKTPVSGRSGLRRRPTRRS